MSSTTKSKGLCLVVDDQPEILEFAQAALEHFNYDVLTAKSGQEALALFAQQSQQVSLVVLDLSMPRMSGADVLQALYALRQDIPVILSSGHIRADAVAQNPGARFATYLQKPYGFAELKAALSVVESRQAAD